MKNNKLNDFINKAKKELLNLGNRNPLLNFKLPKSRGVEFLDNAVEIYDQIKNYPNNIEILALEENNDTFKKQKEIFTYDFGDEDSEVFYSNKNLPLSYASYYIYLQTKKDEGLPETEDSGNFCYPSKAILWLRHCNNEDPIVKGHIKNIKDQAVNRTWFRSISKFRQ